MRQNRAQLPRHFAGKGGDSSSESEPDDYEDEPEVQNEIKIDPVVVAVGEEKVSSPTIKEAPVETPLASPPPAAAPPPDVNVKREFYAAPRADDLLKQSSSEEEEEEESSSSESEEEKPRAAPVFKSVKKVDPASNKNKDTKRHEETLRMIERSVRTEQEAKASQSIGGTDPEVLKIDDTDSLDPEAEYQAWKIRELKRIQREREQLEQQEQEQEELEKQRNLTDEQLQEQIDKKLAREQEAKEERPKPGFLQRTYHRGAFFAGEAGDKLEKRNFNERVEDDYVDKSALPAALQVRHGLGLKGQTRYRTLAEEDTTNLNPRNKRPRKG